MSIAETQYTLPDLLVLAGARLVEDRRADCPQCRRKRSLSHNQEVFFCHGCNCKGNAFTLARALGLTKPVSKEEGRALRKSRDKARRAAEWVTERIRVRRQELYGLYRDLLDIYYASVMRLSKNRQDEIGWSCLKYFYKQISTVRAQLAQLEDAPPLERLAFLNADEGGQKGMISEVIACGGLSAADGMFIEVE